MTQKFIGEHRTWSKIREVSAAIGFKGRSFVDLLRATKVGERVVDLSAIFKLARDAIKNGKPNGSSELLECIRVGAKVLAAQKIHAQGPEADDLDTNVIPTIRYLLREIGEDLEVEVLALDK